MKEGEKLIKVAQILMGAVAFTSVISAVSIFIMKAPWEIAMVVLGVWITAALALAFIACQAPNVFRDNDIAWAGIFAPYFLVKIAFVGMSKGAKSLLFLLFHSSSSLLGAIMLWAASMHWLKGLVIGVSPIVGISAMVIAVSILSWWVLYYSEFSSYIFPDGYRPGFLQFLYSFGGLLTIIVMLIWAFGCVLFDPPHPD